MGQRIRHLLEAKGPYKFADSPEGRQYRRVLVRKVPFRRPGDAPTVYDIHRRGRMHVENSRIITLAVVRFAARADRGKGFAENHTRQTRGGRAMSE